MKSIVHTLVLHVSPDIEVLFMAYVILTREDVRERLGVSDHPALKFIPAGILRKEDWPGEEEPEAATLEEKGYLFLDCGRGRLDQHGRPENENRNSITSLDLLIEAVKLDELAPHLVPVMSIISTNDRTGQDVAPSRNWSQCATPHTPRHLRNMIIGWNLLYKDRPETVVRLARTAFGAIERALGHDIVEAELGFTGGSSATELKPEDPALVASFASLGVDSRQYFLLEEILRGAPMYFATLFGLDAENEIAQAVEVFRKEADAALAGLEREWQTAVRDYWSNSSVRDITVQVMTDEGKAFKAMTMVVGRSASTRFGAVSRLGNDRGRNGKPRRNKADVTIQFYGPGRFVIATKGLRLDFVARVLRAADLAKKGVVIGDEEVAGFTKPGNFRFTGKDGAVHDALFLAEYRTNFGNAFRANPFAEPTSLTENEVVDLTIRALAQAE